MARLRMPVIVIALLSLAPHALMAAQQEQGFDSKLAFILTTAFMTLLPLGIAGGVFLWLRKRVREMRQEELEDLATSPHEAE